MDRVESLISETQSESVAYMAFMRVAKKIKNLFFAFLKGKIRNIME